MHALWSSSEQRAMEALFSRLDRYAGSRRSAAPSPVVQLRAGESTKLRHKLRGAAVLPIRHLLKKLGFDEHRLAELRLEHKLVQAMVLQRYCPDVMPATRGLSAWLDGRSHAEAAVALRHLAPGTAIVKPAVGFGSGEHEQIDGRNEALEWLATTPDPVTELDVRDERYIIQERVDVQREYRVHSMEDAVVDGLTFDRYGLAPVSLAEAALLEDYVQQVLDRLSAGFTHHAFLAWDVARDATDGLRVLEINVGGIHQVFEPFFHCSGFFWDPLWGPAMMARVMRFVEERYGVPVSVEGGVDAGVDGGDAFLDAGAATTYEATARWKALLDLSAEVGSRAAPYITSVGDATWTKTSSSADQAFDAVLQPMRRQAAGIWDEIRHHFMAATAATAAARASAPASRQALLSIESDDNAALTETELVVTRIWCDILGQDALDAETDFFDAGGHSLAAIQICSRIRHVFGVEVPAVSFLGDEPTTIAGVSRSIDSMKGDAVSRVDALSRG